MVAQLRERKVWSTVERACAVIEQSAEWWHRARGGGGRREKLSNGESVW